MMMLHLGCFYVPQLINKSQHAVSGALDQSGVSGAEKYAKGKWFGSKTLTFMSSASPAPVRDGFLEHINITQ